MRIEHLSGELNLGRGDLVTLHDGAGGTVCCTGGTLWITEEGHTDVVLQSGGCYRLQTRGVTIIGALGSARATLQ